MDLGLKSTGVGHIGNKNESVELKSKLYNKILALLNQNLLEIRCFVILLINYNHHLTCVVVLAR